MRFTCEKALLQAAISTTSRAVSPKSSIPALEGILVEAGSQLRLTGYNLETGIRAVVPADVAEEGTLVLSARLFGEIIRKLPDDMVSFRSENYMVHIQCGMSQFHILGTDPEEFPELPSVDHQNAMTISQAKLKAMIGQTLFAVSDNESRPIHTGSLFEVEGESLTVVSVDGYRLAVRREPVDFSEDLSFVVPGKTLSELLKLIKDSEEPVEISAGRRHILFKIDNYTVISSLLEGEFLNYKAAIPPESQTEVVLKTREAIDSVERVSLLITDRLKSPIRCLFDNNEVKLNCTTSMGRASDQLDVEMTGQSVEIGFNNRYLLEALRNTECDEVKVQLGGPLSPMKVVPKEGDSFLFLVLPVRLKTEQ